jgi:hypothetical protein
VRSEHLFSKVILTGFSGMMFGPTYLRQEKGVHEYRGGKGHGQKEKKERKLETKITKERN